MKDIRKSGIINSHHQILVFYFLIISALILSSESQINVIKSLPGYPGNLPFNLETGYIGVGKNEEVQLFYYFTESERNAEEDPIFVWITGGPGCSALSGLVFEIGPMSFNFTASDFESSSLPKLQRNRHSWTKVASIIFLDSPVGSGFSYGTNPDAYYTDDLLQSQHVYQFLSKWLMERPKFKANPFYISGDSYSGMIVPIIVQEILNGNENKLMPELNIRGYILGNPMTEEDINTNMQVKHAHRLSLLSDELYESAKAYCNNDFANIDPNNANCLKSSQIISNLTALIYPPHVLEPFNCNHESPIPLNILHKNVVPYKQQCRDLQYKLSNNWANDMQVREALHIREDTVKNWDRCNRSLSITYRQSVHSSVKYHQSFKNKFLRALIYSGDQDSVIPYEDTIEWIKQLNLSIDDHWRPWFVDGQVAGYVTEYIDFPYHLTFSTIKGGGHTAPEYKPRETFSMIDRWLGLSPL